MTKKKFHAINNHGTRAVIDLGTNTFHLLIADVSEDHFQELEQLQIPVMIGKGGIGKDVITTESFERGLAALEQFQGIIDDYPVISVVATGTSAIRNAKNGGAFLATIKERFGIEVQTINGDQEAELIYKGVSNSFQLPDEPVLVMDIGGGSVEFIIGLKNQILWKQSFEIGVSRLIERFVPIDPMPEKQAIQIKTYLKEKLQPIFLALAQTENEKGKISSLVGSAGSFESIRDIIHQDLNQENFSIGAFADEVSQENLMLCFSLILGSSQQERKNLKGLVEFRLDMIVMATLIIETIWQECGLSKLTVSKYALKEGLLLHSHQF